MPNKTVNVVGLTAARWESSLVQEALGLGELSRSVYQMLAIRV